MLVLTEADVLNVATSGYGNGAASTKPHEAKVVGKNMEWVKSLEF